MIGHDFRWSAYGLAVVGGVLLSLGQVGFGAWPLALVALVPLWAALELPTARTWRTAFAVGWTYGVVAMGGSYHWMLEAAHVFSGLGMTVTVGFYVLCSMYLGLQYAFQGALYWTVRTRGWQVPTAALSTLLVTEWLFPKWFPVYLGNALVDQTILVQIVDLGGPLLLSALAGMANVAIFELLRCWRLVRKLPVAPLAAAATFFGFTLIYGAVRMNELDDQIAAAPSLEMGLVQANVTIDERRADPSKSMRRHLEQSSDLEAQADLDLLVWPETAYFPWFGRRVPFPANPLRTQVGAPLLFGSYSVDGVSERRRLYNTAFLMGKDGYIRALYDKTHLLVGGEYLPFGETFPFLYELSPNTGRLTSGPQLDPLLLGPWRISTPICYEDILPRYIRSMVSHGNPHVLINLTDDVWLGTGQAPWSHFRLAQLRAVEHRRYLVRATNSGVSAIVDPIGRVVVHSDVGTRENLRATVHMMQGQTVYGRLGDWVGWFSLVALPFMLRRRPKPNICA